MNGGIYKALYNHVRGISPQPPPVSHDPSDIILIWWFSAQETFIIISNVKKKKKQLCGTCDIWIFFVEIV